MTDHRRFLRLLLAVAMFLVLGSRAASATDAQEAQEAQHFIQDLAQKAIATVAAQNISANDRQQRFRQLFVSSFDIPKIAKFVMGRAWRIATPAQQITFLKDFEDMQVLVWSRRFTEYHGETLQDQGATSEANGDWLVTSQIVRPNQPPIPVQWRVHPDTDGKLRIVDIIPESVSMALTQREEYADLLQSNGGSIDALISSMEAKNKQLAANH